MPSATGSYPQKQNYLPRWSSSNRSTGSGLPAVRGLEKLPSFAGVHVWQPCAVTKVSHVAFNVQSLAKLTVMLLHCLVTAGNALFVQCQKINILLHVPQ